MLTSAAAECRARRLGALLLSTLLVAGAFACAARGASSIGASRSGAVSPPSSPELQAVASVTVELTDAGTGRLIHAAALGEGDRAVLTWTNSLFRLPVEQVFLARGGRLELWSIEYRDPSGTPSPRVRPEEAPERVQTGGPFLAEGLHQPVNDIVFRVGEIGDPTFTVAGKSIRFLDEVGFGGAVRLVAR